MAEGPLDQLCDGQGVLSAADASEERLLHDGLDVPRAVSHHVEETREEMAYAWGANGLPREGRGSEHVCIAEMSPAFSLMHPECHNIVWQLRRHAA